jgi:hypothetical protein
LIEIFALDRQPSRFTHPCLPPLPVASTPPSSSPLGNRNRSDKATCLTRSRHWSTPRVQQDEGSHVPTPQNQDTSMSDYWKWKFPNIFFMVL